MGVMKHLILIYDLLSKLQVLFMGSQIIWMTILRWAYWFFSIQVLSTKTLIKCLHVLKQERFRNLKEHSGILTGMTTTYVPNRTREILQSPLQPMLWWLGNMEQHMDTFDIARWLVGQRNANGMYKSFRDTVLAMRSLKMFKSRSHTFSVLAQRSFQCSTLWENSTNGIDFWFKVSTFNVTFLVNYHQQSILFYLWSENDWRANCYPDPQHLSYSVCPPGIIYTIATYLCICKKRRARTAAQERLLLAYW